jgi:hypothetical protein
MYGMVSGLTGDEGDVFLVTLRVTFGVRGRSGRLWRTISAVTAVGLIVTFVSGGSSVIHAGKALATTPVTGSLQPAAGQFYSVPTVKVLDTRSGIGGTTGPLSSGQTATFTATGEGNVPASGVSSIYMIVSAITPTTSGCLVDYPGGASDPGLCNTSFETSQNTTDSDVVAVSSSGTVAVTNQSSGSVQVAVSIVGYFGDGSSDTAGQPYAEVTQQPIMDTRSGLNAPKAQVAAGSSVTLQVTGNFGVPSDASGVAVFLGAVNASASGTADAYPSDQPDPGYSLLSYYPGEVVRDFVFEGLSASGELTVANTGSAPVDLILDIAGYFVSPTGIEAGATFTAMTPSRILDTRNTTAVAANGSVTFTATGTAGIPSAGVSDVAESVAALSPQDAGYLTVYPEGTTDPSSPTVNFVGGDNQDNDLNAAVVSSVSPTGEETITNHSSGTVQVVVSTRGYFSAPTAPAVASFVTSSYSSGTATVAWEAPNSDGGAAIENYKVTLGSGPTQTLPNTTEQATFTTTSTDTVTVTATNAVGAGPVSSAASVNGGTAGTYPQITAIGFGETSSFDSNGDEVVTAAPDTQTVGAGLTSAVDIPSLDVTTTDSNPSGVTTDGPGAGDGTDQGQQELVVPVTDDSDGATVTNQDLSDSIQLAGGCIVNPDGMATSIYAPVYKPVSSKKHFEVSGTVERESVIVHNARLLTTPSGSQYWTAQDTDCAVDHFQSNTKDHYRQVLSAVEITNKLSNDILKGNEIQGTTKDPSSASYTIGYDVKGFNASVTIHPTAVKKEVGSYSTDSGLGLVPSGYDVNNVWDEWDGRDHPGDRREGSDNPEASGLVGTYELPESNWKTFNIYVGGTVWVQCLGGC